MELLELYRTLVNPITVVAYILGIVTFLITIFVRMVTEKKNKSKAKHDRAYYWIEFIYTFLALTLIIVICAIASISNWLLITASVMMGLFGAPLIKQFEEKENTIADRLSNTVIDKIDTKVGERVESGLDSVESDLERTFDPPNTESDIIENNEGDSN